MTNKTAAIRYARALLDVAVKEDADLEQIERELARFLALSGAHPTLEKVLLNPAIPAPRKEAAVSALAARLNVLPVVAKLVSLLASRDRLVLLPELLTAYRDRLLEHRRIVRAEVTTAVSLPADRAQAIERELSQLTGRSVALATKVDPSIIGGVVARVGSTVYDGSIATQLQRMKQRLVESV
jgi:F-type H+-transporting ATPase subunit delta